MNFKLTVILVVFYLCTLSVATPIFGLFGSRYNSGGGGGGGDGYQGRSYNDIARVINPSPYAFPGRSPYPSQPFWTYSG